MNLIKLTSITLLSGTALVGFASSAFALEAKAFTDSIAAAYATSGYQITFGDATLDGDTITVNGLTVGMAAAPTAEPEKLDTQIVFSGVAEVDGGYTAREVSISDINATLDGVTITAKDIKGANVWVPANGTATATDTTQFLTDVTTGPISFSSPDGEVVSIASIAAKSEFLPQQGADTLEAVNGNATVSGLKIDLSSIKTPEDRATIDGLGINIITGSAYEAFSWTPAAGDINISELSVTLDGLGKLNMTFDLGGYTSDLLTNLMKVSETATGTPEEIAAAQEAAGMEVLSKLSVAGASIRYEDAGLVNKALDFTAASQGGGTRADLVTGLNLMVPAMMSSLGTHAFFTEAGTAISTFLSDPKNIELRAQPAAPVPAMELAAAAASPDTLIDKLALTVKANQ